MRDKALYFPVPFVFLSTPEDEGGGEEDKTARDLKPILGPPSSLPKDFYGWYFNLGYGEIRKVIRSLSICSCSSHKSTL